jgi:hypothetical protein
MGVLRRRRSAPALAASVAAAALLAVFLVGGVRQALGKAAYASPYGYQRTWDAAVRLVRVDNGWKVDEKDDAAGYILFQYKSPESAKPTPGSLELVRGRDADSPVSVLAVLPQMPHYHEQLLIDALASKMRREYGDPPPPRKTPPPVDVDAGADGGS